MKLGRIFFMYLFMISSICNSKRFLFTRHGQRSPMNYNEYSASRWFPYKPGDLTYIGAKSLEQKGYDMNPQFEIYDKDGNCDINKIEIISSIQQRTILSTLSYLKGICSQNYIQISRHYIQIYLKQFASNLRDFETLNQYDLQDIIYLSEFSRTFVNKNDYLFHGVKDDLCPIVKVENDKIRQSTNYINKVLHFRSQVAFKGILEYIKIQNQENFEINPDDYTVEGYSMKRILGFYSAHKCDISQGLEVPPLTEEQTQLLTQITEFIVYKRFSTEIQMKASLSERFKRVLDALNNDSIELHWQSGHDSNIISLLAVMIAPTDLLELKDISIPPFGSDLHIVVEYGVVNVFYMNTPLKTLFCKNGLDCSIDEFTTFMQQYIVKDIEEFCQS